MPARGCNFVASQKVRVKFLDSGFRGMTDQSNCLILSVIPAEAGIQKHALVQCQYQYDNTHVIAETLKLGQIRFLRPSLACPFALT
jgi:hypothetical protein